MPTRTFLEDINVIELSPTANPANRWRSVFAKAGDDEQETSMPAKALQKAIDLIEKSDLSASAQKACKEAFGQLKKVMGDLPDGMQKALAKAMGFLDDEEQAQEKAALKKSADDASSTLASVREIIKKSVGLLDAEKPAVGAALEALAGVVGHKTVHQQIAELPAEVRTRFEILEKSAKEANDALALVQKAQKDAERSDRVRTMVAKAETTLKHVPLATSDLGSLLATVQEINPKAGDQLFEVLTRVEAALVKSAVFGERGSSAAGSPAGGAWEEVQKMASALVQKSTETGTPMLKSKAISFVLEHNPELANRVESERAAR